MKTLAIALSVILLFSATNVAFSQTSSNSTEQCQTVMHEQIVQKKIDGKLRLQKIQVPMKICTDPNIKSESPKPIPPSYKKISDSLQKLIDSGRDQVKVSIKGNGTIPDFRPIKPSGEYYTMSELTLEQRKEVATKSSIYVKQSQKDLVKFITDNGGKAVHQNLFLNYLSAEIPSKLVKDLEKREDVNYIDRGDKMKSASKILKNKPLK